MVLSSLIPRHFSSEDEEKELDTDCMRMRQGTPVAYARAVCTRPFLLRLKGLGTKLGANMMHDAIIITILL